jgi:hypothetical protein
MHFNNSYILFNTNVEKDDSETNELSLSFRYNIFSCDFTNEEDVQDRKEGISIMNLFNDELNINEDLDDFYFKAYFIQEKNNTNNDNPQENELIKINQKKEIKKLRKKRKLNREVKEIAIKRHTASDDDNILRKIQVQYISFIIHYSNDVVSFFVDDYTNNPCFKDVDYELKKVVNHEKVESLKEKTIGDIIQFDITPKIKKKEKNENEKSLKLILKKCPSLQKYFKTNYLEFFKKYYKNENDYLEVNGQIIPFSDKTKTKTFSSLIRKNNNLKGRIKYVCFNYFINNHKKMKKLNFRTKIFNK